MTITREIIKRFLSDVGVIPEHFGKYGITLLDFKLEEKFPVHYDDGDQVDLSLWAAEGILSKAKIRVLLIDLSKEDNQPPGDVCNDPENWKFENKFVTEYALALRVDEKPIYLLRLAYDEEDEGNFLIQDGNSWITPKLLIQLQALIGMETIVDQGMIWSPSSCYEDLLQALTRIVEI